MLRPANIRSIYSFNDYRRFLTHREAERLEELARQLLGKRIIHISATDTGGRVAEILESLVPFEQSLPVESMWRVLTVRHPFFSVTKKIHHALQGSRATVGADGISEGEWQFYFEQSKDIAYAIAGVHADILLIHDVELLAAGRIADTSAKKVFFMHADEPFGNKVSMRLLPCQEGYYLSFLGGDSLWTDAEDDRHLSFLAWKALDYLELYAEALRMF
ncbi:MAG: hypothetical protein A3J55_00435 [Candidatus Ryanbacteria bacterium RIFCSPHIGHO2_02_FULL_45_17b]|uniref:Trehalose synthase N-terminal domain-containing protein n=1 Tax=Candidatus Ryanbacteria bacterium RIFCSPHIGHO2_01_FULL_45_22 TaxID=1802114 RepID=A0A1G2G0L6_9BACT|nr:MAG: hypothetical protein A2719_02900 [Candidatus Ryanbacteria bacterium RIFCSPHIGHO2_01_FULL_45_22]OGZ47009.1 MAG: hypothetical protein A3J55_00435 [Candidatus Ryanbacteria bacterium RIFCSPHIGHO2_02_FULL_45_17b]